MVVYSESEFIEQRLKRRKFEKIVCDRCEKDIEDLYFSMYVRNSKTIGILREGLENDLCPCCISSAVEDALKDADPEEFYLNVTQCRVSENPPYQSVFEALEESEKEEDDDE